MRHVDPESYYYTYTSPGVKRKTGAWSAVNALFIIRSPLISLQEEEALFMKRKQELGIDAGWGAFSVGVPGRPGADVTDPPSLS